jgi:hypothetical protein
MTDSLWMEKIKTWLTSDDCGVTTPVFLASEPDKSTPTCITIYFSGSNPPPVQPASNTTYPRRTEYQLRVRSTTYDSASVLAEAIARRVLFDRSIDGIRVGLSQYPRYLGRQEFDFHIFVLYVVSYQEEVVTDSPIQEEEEP